MVQRSVVLALLALSGVVQQHAVAAQEKASFDPPIRIAAVSVPQPGNPNGPGKVTCSYYADVTVKVLDLKDIGPAAVSVTPVVPGRPLPPCGKQDDPGEVVLKNGAGFEPGGVVGGFLHTAYVDGHDGTTFRFYEARTGKLLYTDRSPSDGLQRVSVQDGVLTVVYDRPVPAPCSILSGGAACWSRFAREARLPPAVAAQPPPVASCRENYAKLARQFSVTPNDSSYIQYAVTMTLDRSGRATVLSRGTATCWPSS